MRLKKILRMTLIFFVLAFIAIQFVPYGPGEAANPPVRQEPKWDSPRTRELAVRACYDCHSNETKWPWYSKIAPMKWLVWWDVKEGREHLNFSEFDRKQKNADEATTMIMSDEMPLWYYLPLHSEAKLGDEDKLALIDGLDATLADED